MRLIVPFVPLEVEVRRRPLGRPTWRVRDLLVLVLLVAIGLHLAQSSARRRTYRALADLHARRATEAFWADDQTRNSLAVYAAKARAAESDARRSDDPRDAERSRRLARELYAIVATQRESLPGLRKRRAYHEGLSAKYHSAAERPWLPLWPDPPAP